jgi:hypothetical protein
VSSRPGRPTLSGRPRWAGLAFVAVFLLLALVASRACQDQDTRIDDEQAVATAREAIDFEPERTSVKFLRQGVGSHPYYAISFSRGREGEPGARLATVLVDARGGDVEDVNVDY